MGFLTIVCFQSLLESVNMYHGKPTTPETRIKGTVESVEELDGRRGQVHNCMLEKNTLGGRLVVGWYRGQLGGTWH